MYQRTTAEFWKITTLVLGQVKFDQDHGFGAWLIYRVSIPDQQDPAREQLSHPLLAACSSAALEEATRYGIKHPKPPTAFLQRPRVREPRECHRFCLGLNPPQTRRLTPLGCLLNFNHFPSLTAAQT